MEVVAVEECNENVCSNVPCRNGATCQPIHTGDLCDSKECAEKNQRHKVKGLDNSRCKDILCPSKNDEKDSGKRTIDDHDMHYDTHYNNRSNLSESHGVLNYKCICPPQFTGTDCGESLDPCMDELCQNGATCDILPQGGYVCKCPPGRRGVHCETSEYSQAFCV